MTVGAPPIFQGKSPGGEVTGVGEGDEFRRTCSQATASCLHETVFKNWPQFLTLSVE